MKHQSGVLDPEEVVAVRVLSWRAQGGQWWLFPTTFPGADYGSVFFIPGCRPWPYREQTLTVPSSAPQAASPWTPSLARAWKKAETSSKSFPRALPSLP